MVDEVEATIVVSLIKADEKNFVCVSILGTATEHFQAYLAVCRAASGRFVHDEWRFSPAVGLEVVKQLRADGFVVELPDPDGDERMDS